MLVAVQAAAPPWTPSSRRGLLHQAASLTRRARRTGSAARALALFLSVVQRAGDLGGRMGECIVPGDPESSDSVVAAIPAGASEARVKPELGMVLAPVLADDVQLDERPVLVAPEIRTVPRVAFA